MKTESLESVFHYKAFVRLTFLVLLAVILTTAAEEAGRIRPGLINWPRPNTEANAGGTVDFTWIYAFTQQDDKRLNTIKFGLCFKSKLTENLITVTKVDKNNSTTYKYNVTKKYEKRLQWVGKKDKVSFELANVTKDDTNSYLMVMSFGSLRGPISDHVELIVNYPPTILNKPPAMRQVRLPEGESVHISCRVTSCPRAVVTWSKEGHVVQNQTERHDLTITKGRMTDSGVYTCVAKNKLGVDKQQVLVIVTSCVEPNSKAVRGSDHDQALDDANDPSTLFTMIAPGIVFFVIFAAYFAFRCPAYRNRKRRNRALLNSKATSTSMTTNDEQATSLLADWTNFSDRGEKV